MSRMGVTSWVMFAGWGGCLCTAVNNFPLEAALMISLLHLAPSPSAEQWAPRAEGCCSSRTSRGTRHTVGIPHEASHLEVHVDCHDTSRIVRGKPKRSPTLYP